MNVAGVCPIRTAITVLFCCPVNHCLSVQITKLNYCRVDNEIRDHP